MQVGVLLRMHSSRSARRLPCFVDTRCATNVRATTVHRGVKRSGSACGTTAASSRWPPRRRRRNYAHRAHGAAVTSAHCTGPEYVHRIRSRLRQSRIRCRDMKRKSTVVATHNRGHRWTSDVGINEASSRHLRVECSTFRAASCVSVSLQGEQSIGGIHAFRADAARGQRRRFDCPPGCELRAVALEN